MKITTEDLKASYRGMSNDELLALNRQDLTDMARGCYDREIERRDLHAAAEPEPSPEPEPPDAAEPDEPFVVVKDCSSPDDAWAVQSALEAAGIPARIGDDRVRAAGWPDVGIGRFPVAVPASYAEQACGVLSAGSDEAIVVAARYEEGLFKPVDKIDIAEGTLVEVHIPAASLNRKSAGTS